MTKIKICGITNYNDANYCAMNGVDYLGFIFYSKSPRNISSDDAISISKKLIKKYFDMAPRLVGVFVNEMIEKIIEIVKKCKLDLVQLHGDETPEYIAELKKKLGFSVKIIKAIRVKGKESLSTLDYNVDFFHFDTFSSDKYGGTGKQFNYSLLKNIPNPYFIAGGLNINNMSDAFYLDPLVLDFNSGVEISPGNKDHDKIKQIIERLKIWSLIQNSANMVVLIFLNY